jgi:hypothetical protein
MKHPLYSFTSALILAALRKGIVPTAVTLALLLLAGCPPDAALHPERRGLMASPGFEGRAMRGVYFFPGEGRDFQKRDYTTHPLDERDLHWNTDPSTRGWVMDRMVRAHVNTVVMSYWGDMPQWSPMDICSSVKRPVVCRKKPKDTFCFESASMVPDVIKAVQGRPLVIMPAIEDGNDEDCPELPHWLFPEEFPFLPFELPDHPDDRFAPHLVARIGNLVEFFRGKMDRWAQIYDQIFGNDTDDKLFAKGFEDVARIVRCRHQIDIGFMIDTTGVGPRYSAFPKEAGAVLEQTPAVLAVQGFASEISSGLIINSDPKVCVKNERGLCEPHDNNHDNLKRLADWKRDALHDWIATGVPVILDVTNGFDGRYVWGGSPDHLKGVAFWGDNLNYTEDRWRNWMSELKGPGIKGIVVDAWNGYTEGYATVPSIEHGETVYNWLTDLLEPPPWDYNHMHYFNGARTHRVFGAICEKWIQLGADRRFGAPLSDELPSAHGRMQNFSNQAVIYWSSRTHAHAVTGVIAKTYREIGGDASCLGLPISDTETVIDGKVSHFEHGTINWEPGDVAGLVTCH